MYYLENLLMVLTITLLNISSFILSSQFSKQRVECSKYVSVISICEWNYNPLFQGRVML